MYKEYLCDSTLLNDDIRTNIFSALDLGVEGIVTDIPHISKVAHYIPHGITISTSIDYPYGYSDTSYRISLIQKAKDCGANTVDVMVNAKLFCNKNYKEFAEDLISVDKCAKNMGISIRYGLDYNTIDINGGDFSTCIDLIARSVNPYIFIPSNGKKHEKVIDNIITCNAIEMDYGIYCIANHVYLPDHVKIIREADIFGMRFSNIHILRNCIGV